MYYMMQINYNNIINVRIDISLEITYINIYINNRKYLKLLVQLLHSLPSMFITLVKMLVILWYASLLHCTTNAYRVSVRSEN